MNFGCFFSHDWGPWSSFDKIFNRYDGRGGLLIKGYIVRWQTRQCKRCGLTSEKRV